MSHGKCTATISDLLGEFTERVEDDLRRWLTGPSVPTELAEAMAYCVLDGGKRLRPALVHVVARALDGGRDELTARAAVAVELVHCYSLVHDDLPAMDDDTLRRGRPTAHVKFGEAMAILAGDALVTRAFGILAEAGDRRSAALVAALAAGCGPAGMIAGQVADMGLCEVPHGAEGLQSIHRRKTGALIRAAANMGAICADADAERAEAIDRYADAMGLAFQVYDDLLDVTADAGSLGKTPGKDAASGKRTYVSELGLDEAARLGEALTDRAVEALAPLGDGAEYLRSLARLLADRTY